MSVLIPRPRPVASLDRLLTVCGSRPDLRRSSAYGYALLFLKFYDPELCFIRICGTYFARFPDAGDRLRHNCRA